MKPILEIKNISKKFRIHHEQQTYLSIRDNISGLFKKRKKESDEDFWALKNVSFNIEQGESVGIIGKNGAGKSTLLKILSKITPPTKGKIISRGRIASLLEVGTGFHGELSGKENIFLNGSILGMKRKEIENRFDEIVDFSGVEKFIDTPIKHYSSGMQLRLAFAVAAFLEPQILIIDEVLAVGDTEFQKKCLGKMDEVSRSGRTILFVSHNMAAMNQLSKRSICLYEGEIAAEGKTEDVIDYYLNQEGNKALRIEGHKDQKSNQFMMIYMTSSNMGVRTEYKYDEDIVIAVELFLPMYSEEFELAMRLINKNGNAIFTIHEKINKYYKGDSSVKLNIIIPKKFVTPGRYSWTMCINHPGIKLYDLQTNILTFTILDTGSEFARYDGVDYGGVFASYSVQDLS